MRPAALLLRMGGFVVLAVAGGIAAAASSPITIPTGSQFTGHFKACVITPGFPCPPEGVMIQVNTTPPQNGASGYSLDAWLISDATGEIVSLGNNFPFWIATEKDSGKQWGVFGYNGLLQGFPFPVNSGFFGAVPAKATFSVNFRNTGLPFTFQQSPENSVSINLDSANKRYGDGSLTTSVVFPREVTVPTGGEFTGHFNARIPTPGFECPPAGLLLEVFTEPPEDEAGYSLEAWLISDATGEVYAIPDRFSFWIATEAGSGEKMGIFGYDGLNSSFPFPSAAGFFGHNPAAGTFSVKFRNTGFPFTFRQSPEIGVSVDLVSGDTHFSVVTNSVTVRGDAPRPVFRIEDPHSH